MPAQRAADGLTWLLTVEADTTRRWRSRDCTITVSGVAVAAAAGMRTDAVEERMSSGISSVVLSIELDSDLPAVVAALRVGRVTLALCPIYDETAAAEDGIVVASGRVADVEVDADTGDVSIGLRSLELVDASDLCPAESTITPRTWPLAPEQAQGARPPVVYGAPGSYEYASVTDIDLLPSYDFTDPAWYASIDWQPYRWQRTVGATPALAADTEQLTITYGVDGGTASLTISTYPRYLIVAQHAVDADTCTIWTRSDELGLISLEVGIIQSTDGLGRTVSLADLSAKDYVWRRNGEWWIGWTGAPATSPDLADVLRFMLARAAVPIDWPACESTIAAVRGLQIGGYVDDSTSVVEWIRSHLRVYGVAPRWTPRGLGLRLAWVPSGALPVARLEVGAGATRDAPWRMETGDVDEVAVRWAPARTIERTVETVVRRLGAQVVARDAIEARECWDESTAGQIGQIALYQHGPRETTGVSLDAARWWWLRPGDVVDLTDAAIGATAGPTSRWVVDSVQHTDGSRRSVSLRRLTADRYEIVQTHEVL